MPAISIDTLQISSPEFAEGEMIPARYTCDGDNINPPISIQGIPEAAKSLAIIIDDPDAPGKTFDHWIMWNIAVTDLLKEDSAPGAQGKNSKGENRYTGPCPLDGVHHYHFKVYALDKTLDLHENTSKQQLEAAMKGHILAGGSLIGLYGRQA